MTALDQRRAPKREVEGVAEADDGAVRSSDGPAHEGAAMPRRLGGEAPRPAASAEPVRPLTEEDASAGLQVPGLIAANDGARPPSFETLLSDVPLEVTVELGRVTLPLREVSERLGPGSVIPLSKLTGETLDIRVNDRLVARAEAVAIGERYGVRIVEIVRGDPR